MTVEDPGSSQSSPDQVPRPRDELRKVTDARTMRALAHPVRIALLEELALGGALTATEIGERIGESPTTCSFHLRQLAKYGFVEEAGGGKGRARPWRLTSIGISFHPTNDDPAAEIAAGALFRLVRERWLGRYQAWVETRGSYPKAWRDATDESEYLLYVTPAELKAVNEELLDFLMSKYRERLTDPAQRPAGALPVEILTFSFPVQQPGTASEGDPAASEPGEAGRDDNERRNDEAQ
jgi:DNA-binding transcriptional ArsR family regulator